MRFDEYILRDTSGKTQIKTFHSTVSAGKRMYREHHHVECELSMFLSGSGTYSVGGKSYEFQKGDVFLFSSNEFHCITEISSSETFNLLNIHFEPRILWAESEYSNMSFLKIFFARNKSFENRIDRDNEATQDIRNMILQIENEIKTKPDEYELMARMILNKILITLIRKYDYINREITFSGHASYIEQLEKAMIYIDNNLENEITLDELSKIVSLSSTYFSTVFKKLNGISPWEYITIKRVEKAVKLIKTTQLTKLDIAMQCGFKSSSNFYKAFSKVTGKKPNEIT